MEMMEMMAYMAHTITLIHQGCTRGSLDVGWGCSPEAAGGRSSVTAGPWVAAEAIPESKQLLPGAATPAPYVIFAKPGREMDPGSTTKARPMTAARPSRIEAARGSLFIIRPEPRGSTEESLCSRSHPRRHRAQGSL